MSVSNFDEIRKGLKSYLTEQQIYDVILDSFDSLKLNREKVELCWILLFDSKLFPNFKVCGIKSKELSEKYRLEGNRFFASRKNIDAIRSYTLAAGHALADSKELVLAIANRSAVSIVLNDHSSCLKDINYAMDRNYPDNLKYKLLERKGKSLLLLGQLDEAAITLKESLTSLRSSDLEGEKLDKIKRDIEDLLQKCYNNTSFVANNSSDFSSHVPSLSYGPNEKIESASKCIEINYSEQMGRHLIATQDIYPGDVLAVEKPYVSILLPESRGLYCSNCIKRCHSLMPCSYCVQVYYCSDKCELEALKKYHRVECGLLRSLLELGCGKLELLAVRTVIEAANQGSHLQPLINMSHYIDQSNFSPSQQGFSDGVYKSDSYCAVHCLEGNSHHRSGMDLFRRSVVAACIVEALDRTSSFFKLEEGDHSRDTNIISSCKIKEKTRFSLLKSFKLLEPYFQRSKHKDMGQLKSDIGGLLLKYLQVMPSNAHEISEMLIDKNNNSTESIEVGGALYPLLSLTNHSCDPNVVRHSHDGDTVVLTAIQYIQKGQQIFDNYGYHHAVHDKTFRQTSLLSQYHFYCHCEACLNDWPLYQHMTDSPPLYKYGIDIKKVEKSSEKFNQILSDILDSNTSENLEFLQIHLRLLHESISRPHKEYSGCQEAMKQCLSLRANYYVINS